MAINPTITNEGTMIRFNIPTIGRKDLESVLHCMIGDDLTAGDRLKDFSSLLKRRLGLFGVTVLNNYFAPFEIILGIIGTGRRDEVILPSYSKGSILEALLRQGVEPVLVDLDDDSLLPSREDIGRKISNRTKCIVLSQLFGIPHDLSTYREFEVPLVEDLDGALGSSVNGAPAGMFGDFVTMSFTDESIITTGTGGMVGSGNRNAWGKIKEAVCDEQLMSDFNASLGISQLVKLDENLQKRREIGEYYDRAVMESGASFIGRDDQKLLCYSSYVVRTKTPFEECARFFKGIGIPVRRGIGKPLHQVLGLNVEEFGRTELLYHEIILLPIYPALNKDDIENTAKGIRTIL
jgi:perosamine synthetase